MKNKKILTSLLSAVVLFLLTVVGGAYFDLNSASAATITNLIISPSSTPAGVATNFIGRTSTSWLFQFKNPSLLPSGTSTMRGIAITWPNVSQGGPNTPPATNWDFTNATVFSTVATSTYGVGGVNNVVTTTPPLAVMGAGSPTPKMIITMSTTTPANTFLNIRVDGVNNPLGNQSSALSSMTWTVQSGNITGAGPTLNVDPTNYDTGTTSSVNLIVRKGGAMISNSSSTIFTSNTNTSAAAVYNFTFVPTTAIPVNGKIVVAFPSAFNVNDAATTTDDNDLNGSGYAGATEILSMTTSTGTTPQGTSVKKITLTVGTTPTTGGQALTIVLSGIVNPSSVGVYRPVFVYTLDDNNALLDGSPDSFDSTEYTNQPPPPDTVHIGGTNNLVFTVKKILADGTSAILGPTERNQVQVLVECPDKQFFVGAKYPDVNSQVTFKNLLDCNYVAHVKPNNASDFSFFQTFISPSAIVVPAVSNGVVATSTGILSFKVSDVVITGQITGGPADNSAGTSVFVRAYNADGFESYSPIWNKVPGFGSWTGAPGDMGLSATGTGWFMINAAKNSTWKVSFPTTSFHSSTTTYWTPVVPDAVTNGSATTTIPSTAFISSNSTLVVGLTNAAAATVNDACVSVKRGGSGDMMMGGMNAICQPNGGGTNANKYVFQVPNKGDIVIDVFRNGKPDEYAVSLNNAVAATTTKNIVLAAPSTSITVNVVDSSGNNMNGVPVFAKAENGFGFANAMTATNGQATLYVPSGSTYEVRGFSSFGQLGPQTGVAVGGTVTFTINSGTLKSISGQVTANGVGVGGVGIGVRGTGNTTGGNGTVTNSDGTYKLYLPAGTYSIGGWSPDLGGLQEQAVDVSSVSQTGKNWALNGQGTIQVNMQNGTDLCYTVNSVETCKMFVNAYNPTTNKGNGTDTWKYNSATSTRVASIKVPAGTYTLNVDSPNGTLDSESVSVTADAITYVTSTIPGLITVNGTITSGGDNTATVWVSKQGGRGFSVTTGSDGTYLVKVPAGTYQMSVTKVGYMPQGFAALDFSAATTTNVTLAQAGATITGIITGPSEGFVSAQNAADSKIWTGSPIQADGTYSLSVGSNTSWIIYAQGPCYQKSGGLTASAGDSGKNMSLTMVTSCSTNVQNGQSIVPSSGGTVSNGTKMSVNIPANALGNGTSAVSLTVGDPQYVNNPSGANSKVISNGVQSITASNGTSNISSLSSSVQVTLAYSTSDLPVGFDETKLQAGYWDSTNVRWEAIPSTVNTTAKTITFSTDHFTDFGPIIPGTPDAPANLAATGISTGQVNLTWDASVGATSYVVYRSTTNSNFVTSIATPSGTSYSNTGLSPSVTYYYEVAAVNENGEGQNSSSVAGRTLDLIVTGGSSGYYVPPSITTAPAAPSSPSAPVTTPSPIIPTIPSVVIPAAPAVTQPVAVVPLGDLRLNPPAVLQIKLGKNLAYDYSFKNSTGKTLKIGLHRTVTDPNGKVIIDTTGTRTLAKNKSVSMSFKSAVTKNILLGSYVVKVEVYNLADNAALDSGSFTYEVLAPAPVQPVVIIPLSSEDIIFTVPNVLSFVRGKSFKYGYTVTNSTGAKLQVKAVRQVLDPSGKALLSTKGMWNIQKDGKSIFKNLAQSISKKAALGIYTVSLKLYDLKGTLLVEKSFSYEVK